MAKNQKYSEGDIIAVPLPSGGYSIGLITRKTRLGTLGYFFGPRLSSIPSIENVGLSPNDAIYISRFSDLGIKDGSWTNIGKYKSWHKDDWPTPLFKNTDLISGTSTAVEYSDDLFNSIERPDISSHEAEKLFEDVFSGYEALEVHLESRL